METTTRQPIFRVRDVPVYGDLILAPMDGYSDLPFRALCAEFGSAMAYTEFVSVDGLSRRGEPDEITARKLQFDPREQPKVIQIYGHDEDRLVESARRLQDLGPDIIDLNLGCYVRKIAERGAGSGMLRDPAKIARLFARLTRELRVPVTAKIRLGWDERTRNYMEVARILEESGASLIAVHARTKAQGYTGGVDWNAIAEIKQAMKIPVIGNGDVKTIADITRIKAQTGCDGVMIGRAAVGNPWIFARQDREQIAPSEKIALMRRHLARHLEFYGARNGLVLFRKHAYRYVQGGHGAAALRHALMLCDDVRAFERLLDEYARALERNAN
ncbi:MAG: tRNA dihydrouridine synthase DusB [Anaerolineales bacterium]|nr:tRNA dihydrouridine synthase DusB [Anaerolineales bacterium]